MRPLGIDLAGIDLERYQELRDAIQQGDQVEFIARSLAERKR
jgi:hypothetical protein